MSEEIIVNISSGINNIIDNRQLNNSVIRVLMNNQYNCYSSPKGIKELRLKIAELINYNWQFKVNPHNMIITTGCQQSLNLISSALLNNGDNIIIEEPTYWGAVKLFKQKKCNIIGVTISEDGIDIGKVKQMIIQFKPKLIYVVPTFNNPTGYAWSKQNRKAFLKIINQYKIIVIEDDPYSMINFTNKHYDSLYKLNNGKNIIYLGTFSKYISPAINIGYIIADEIIINNLYKYKETSDLCTSLFNQYVILDYLSNNNLKNEINKKIPLYISKLKRQQYELSKKYGNNITYSIPKGGLFFFCQFKEEMVHQQQYFISKNNKYYLRINICSNINKFIK